ncbi:MAG: endonuclease/exonuclease/phosphatase family protein [Planctomycetes bacterium]|nr:endonuclease/exonuclease/phosphatase family protein [Planctomycetota bacterium]
MDSKATPSLLGTLAGEYKPDVIVLAESAHGIATWVEEVSTRTGLPYNIPFHVTNRIQFLVKMPRERVQPLYDGEAMAIRHIQPVLGQDFILAAAHLPSKLFLNTEEQAALCCRWIDSICQAETKVGHQRTVVIGDLNMNPFEPGVVGAEGFHAVSSRAVAARKTRTVLDRERPLFYNPMWSMMGDVVGPPGTYYYASGRPVTYFWNTFDQILLRPEFARYFVPGDVVIASSVGDESLLSPGGIPNQNVSDHLPIIGTIRLEMQQ